MLRRLVAAYGPRPLERWGPAVEVLVGTILSQNTSRANSSAGLRHLKQEFRNWTAVADAPVEAIERCIRISGLSNLKAPRIRAILQEVRRRHGRVSLEFLKRLPPQEARGYLLGFQGVGPKTASCVLLFSFGMPLLPVDTHIVRIAARLGWVPEGTSAERCEELLTPHVRPDDRYSLHVLLIAHGRQTCRARNPRCEWCDLLDLCPFGQHRTPDE